MKIGSDAHKELFCQTFFDGHVKYEPPELPWPKLEGEPLELLRGLPFWTHARQFESDAGPMIRAVAAVEPDPLIREALELQAFEEERHARLVNYMIELYDLPADEAEVEVPRDPVAEFIDFGFEECLDSFGAFGLFRLARDARIAPDPLFDVFDNVMREEAQHIVFFINWYAHREASRGATAGWLRGPRALWHYAKALRNIADLVRNDDADEIAYGSDPRGSRATRLLGGQVASQNADRRRLRDAAAGRSSALRSSRKSQVRGARFVPSTSSAPPALTWNLKLGTCHPQRTRQPSADLTRGLPAIRNGRGLGCSMCGRR